jgi:alpha/beta superfamily hydrolase
MFNQKKFTLSGSAGILEGITHLPATSPQAIAVVAHPLPTMGGTMENKIVTTLAKSFVEFGFVALRFNFRGVGGSEGNFDEGNGEVEDVLAVTKHAREQYGELPLILAGFSFGGFVQACAAQQLHPQQMILIAPAVGRFPMPPISHDTLIIHGEQDEIVPLVDVFNWARPQQLPIVVLPGVDHFFHGRLTQLKQIVRQHFMGLTL